MTVRPTAQSDLMRWLTENRAEFTAMLKDYRPQWEPLVEWFGREGLLRLLPEFFDESEALRSITRRKVIRSVARRWERVNDRVAMQRRSLRPTRDADRARRLEFAMWDYLSGLPVAGRRQRRPSPHHAQEGQNRPM
jgi:hypothetical protein